MEVQELAREAKRRLERLSQSGAALLRRLGAFWRRSLAARLTTVAAVAAALTLISAGAGYWAAERDVPKRIQAHFFDPNEPAGDELTVAWRRVATNRHDLGVARIRLERDDAPLAWALAPVGDHLVFSSRHGQLSVLGADGRLASLGLQTPMRLEALREAPLSDDPVFEIGDVRTFDVLTVETGPQRYDLYASYSRYRDGCFEVAVSRTPLEATAEGVRAATGEWEDVYAVKPCVAIKYTGMRFAGHEGGGRLVMLDPDTLLLSVGVYQYDNVGEGQLAGQDPQSDLGKIVAVTLSTGEARIFARGFRNPQGLLVTRDGEVWETEHGPQGGDEVNRIVEGGNYGWPLATYGMDYGAPPIDWPYSETPGRHDGYDEPSFFFTPSIGVSNIIEPDAREFPRWDRHFVVASLTAHSLYVLTRRGDAIISAEPIEMEGRLRDIVSLPDGRIAVATDGGDIVFIRNAQKHDGDGAIEVSGLTALADPLPEDRWETLSDEDAGARAFFYYCSNCHNVVGQVGIGPPLDGLMGRRVGGTEGYNYSAALAEHGGTWNRRLLRSFIAEPDRRFAGTIMPRSEIPSYELGPLVAYLASTRALSSTDQ